MYYFKHPYMLRWNNIFLPGSRDEHTGNNSTSMFAADPFVALASVVSSVLDWVQSSVKMSLGHIFPQKLLICTVLE